MSALLAGLAALVLVLPRRPVRPRERPPDDASRLTALASAGAGLTGWVLVGGHAGVVAGTALALLAPWAVRRLAHDTGDDAEVHATLPLALELLAACLAGGAPPGRAVQVVADAFPGALGTRLARVAAGLDLGTPPEQAWVALGAGRGAAGAAARALARAAVGGAPVAETVRRIALEARRAQRAEALRRAARAGVLAVLPLGACFLPAFVLLGVVPAVAGLAGPALHSLG